MTVIVADASAIVEFLLRTPRGKPFERVLGDDEADVHVPSLCDVEVASALRRLSGTKALSTKRRDEALIDYVDLPLTRHGHVVLLARVLELGANMSAYDAVYVALAEALDAAFVTADDRLASAVSVYTGVRLVGAE